MAIDGTFSIVMNISMGAQKGTITFNPGGETLSGFFKSLLGTSEFSNGTMDGNNFDFSFDADAPMLGRQTFVVTGIVEGDGISGVVKLGVGSFTFQGQREG
jgi:hypothetical protein